MDMDRFGEVQIKRSVMKNIRNTKFSGCKKAGIGRNYARFFQGENSLVVSEAAGANDGMGLVRTGFIKAYNNVRISGAVPVAVSDTILMPEKDEQTLKHMIMELSHMGEAYSVDVISGHTQIVSAVTEPLMTFTMYGVFKEALQDEKETEEEQHEIRRDNKVVTSGNAYMSLKEKTDNENKVAAGMDIVMSGNAGCLGSVQLAYEHRDGLYERYSRSYIDNIFKLEEMLALKTEPDIAYECGAVYGYNVGFGGVYCALWDMADSLNIGIDISHDYIPIVQETIEVCEFAGVNPYLIDGTGAALFITDNGQILSDRLYEAGYEAAVIGKVTDGHDRTVSHDGERRFLTPRG